MLKRRDASPDLGAYRYTYVLEYEVLIVHRQDPEGKYQLNPGDRIFVGHYKPRTPRSKIKDNDWGDTPLGGRLSQFVAIEGTRPAQHRKRQPLRDIPPCSPEGGINGVQGALLSRSRHPLDALGSEVGC